MEEKTVITICLGSSCFARGNKEIIKIVKSFIVKNNLSEKIEFKGSHCFGECNKGPSIKINDKIFYTITENNIFNFLEQNLGLIKS